MESEKNSGSTGGGFGDGPPRLTQKEHKTLNAPDTDNEQGRQSTTETDFAEGGSQLVGKKRLRENEDSPESPRAGHAEINDEAGPVTMFEETVLLNDISQRFGRLVAMVDQIIGVINTAEDAYLVAAYAIIEEDISDLQDAIKSFENAAIGDGEDIALLREARDALETFVTSLSMPDDS